MTAQTLPSLGRNRDFLLLTLGQGVSRLGTSAAILAMPLLVLRTTGSPLQVGIVEAVWGVSYLLVALPAGAMVDRMSRRLAMIVSDLAGVLAHTVLVVCLVTGWVTLPVLLAVVVVLGVTTPLFGPAATASIRQVVPAAQMPSALGVNQVRNQTAALTGPLLGGLLFQLSPSLPFVVQAASLLLSTQCIMAIRAPLPAPPRTLQKSSIWQDTAAGIRFVVGTAGLRMSLVISAVANFAFSGVYLAVIVVVAQTNGSSVSAGIVASVLAVGSLIGALVATLLANRLTPRRVIIGASLVYAITVPSMALVENEVWYTSLLLASFLVTPLWNVTFGAYQVRITPDRLQGRVQAAVNVVALAIAPAGQFGAGMILATLGASAVFTVFGLTLVLVAIVTLSSGELRLMSPESIQSAPDTPTSSDARPVGAQNVPLPTSTPEPATSPTGSFRK